MIRKKKFQFLKPHLIFFHLRKILVLNKFYILSTEVYEILALTLFSPNDLLGMGMGDDTPIKLQKILKKKNKCMVNF